LLKCLPSELANPTTKLKVAVQLITDATVLEENYRLTPTVLGHRPVDLLRVPTAPAAPAVTAMLFLIAILVAEAAAARAPHTGPPKTIIHVHLDNQDISALPEYKQGLIDLPHLKPSFK
jgi:hypothetical protein